MSSTDLRFQKFIVGMIAAAVVFKLFLYFYIISQAPHSIFRIDSDSYLADAQGWVNFFLRPSAGLAHSLFRTPGYPLFLATLHGLLAIPLMGIVGLQIVLNILTAGVVYKTMTAYEKRIGLLAVAIVLLDLPATIYSSMILTESLHLFVMSLFLFSFIKYLDHRGLKWLVAASLLLAISIYIRPVGYYLGFALAGFIVVFGGAKMLRAGIVHALLSLFLIYGLLGIWEYLNLKAFGKFTLCSIDQATVQTHSLIGAYARETKERLKQLPPAVYYVCATLQHFLSLMTTPGSMRYFGCRPLAIFATVWGYLLVIFWWAGLLVGLIKDRKDVVYIFLMMVVLYFISVTIVSTGWGVTARFRVPMLGALAMLSARGWFRLISGKYNS